jgi:hypothetical protein
MRLVIALAAVVLCALPMAARDLPHDVQAYADRREGCNHWSGEEPYDNARRIQIEKSLSDLRCTALDRDERILKRHYRNNPTMLRKIRAAHDADPG